MLVCYIILIFNILHEKETIITNTIKQVLDNTGNNKYGSSLNLRSQLTGKLFTKLSSLHNLIIILQNYLEYLEHLRLF